MIKPKFSGIDHTGKMVSFNRVWGGYTFTDKDCEELLKGNTITVFTKNRKFRGKLGIGEFKNSEGKKVQYYGFVLVEPITDISSGDKIPPAWCGHFFTTEELNKLANNQIVVSDDFTSKTGRKFHSEIYYNNKYKCIIPNIAKEEDLLLYILKNSRNSIIDGIKVLNDEQVQLVYNNSISLILFKSDWDDLVKEINERPIIDIYNQYAFEAIYDFSDIREFFDKNDDVLYF